MKSAPRSRTCAWKSARTAIRSSRGSSASSTRAAAWSASAAGTVTTPGVIKLLRQSGYDYGGQAVIEGVMIRGPGGIGIAVRRPDGGITVRRRAHRPLTRAHPVLALPLVRGAVALYEALVLGIDALLFSANEAAASEDEK